MPVRHIRFCDRGLRRASRPATTLVELLVVVSIIGLLSAIILPAIGGARAQMKQMRCASDMRSAAIEFQFFAENLSANGQGDSEALGRTRFHITDFLDASYRLDEFWDLGDEPVGTLKASREVMMCTAGSSYLTKYRGFACGSSAVSPASDVTVAVNMRLYRSVLKIGNQAVLAPVSLTSVRSNVLNHPYVPLLIDVDGQEAGRRGIEPFYTAPPVEHDDPYAGGHYWMPSARHGGRTNVAFVGGHVLSSGAAADENWSWSYQGQIGHQ